MKWIQDVSSYKNIQKMCSLILTVVLLKKVEILTSKVYCTIHTILLNPRGLWGDVSEYYTIIHILLLYIYYTILFIVTQFSNNKLYIIIITYKYLVTIPYQCERTNIVNGRYGKRDFTLTLRISTKTWLHCFRMWSLFFKFPWICLIKSSHWNPRLSFSIHINWDEILGWVDVMDRMW